MGERMIPKDKKGGVVTSVVIGTGGLIIAVIVLFVILSSVFNAEILPDSTGTTVLINTTTYTTVNESGAYFGNYTSTSAVCSFTGSITNKSGSVIPATNYTQGTGVNICKIYHAGASPDYNNTIWVLNSTTTYSVSSAENETAFTMKESLEEGVGNISSKIPTILLIVAVVFLFGALALLIRNSEGISGIIGGGNANSGSL
jgi:hypothetical protein